MALTLRIINHVTSPSPASSILLRALPSQPSRLQLLQATSSSVKTAPKPRVDRHPQDKGVKMDHAEERYSKEGDFSAKTMGFSETIMPHILNLYASRATARDFEIYADNATFEDPLMCANGTKQIKSAFYSLPKVFKESRIVEYTVKENEVSPGKHEVLVDNKQYYKFMGKDINMISLIKLYIENGKVVRHEDWWDKKPPGSRETEKIPMLGRVMEAMRRGAMLATHAMMGFGKDPQPKN
ncbi:uncharacterized protein LOC116188289 [Punica granatum]|uniref:Uncharacterized protein LOC116188289 n=2 Tax=Punica granatum TaxID=22663 RepID=A0A218XSN0_PUNGR|nr:uncharacterized protein LOC116188289 [Punica granatum]OWM87666.1 hypothetical protein CDL15_Pgr022779 [Punica granatum]